MTKDEIVARLKSVEPQLQARGVSHAALFGSRSRGEARPDSDIDIMVEIDPAAGLGTFEYVGILDFLSDMFPPKVDVSNRKEMRDYVRPSAERDAVYAF